MELAFPLGIWVAMLGGGALALGAVNVWWSHAGRAVAPSASAAWQWCLAFVTAVAALMLAHVTGFGLTAPGVTRVIGELGVVWGSDRWSDALAFALDPVAAALLAAPVLLVAVTAFVDLARPSPTAESRRRSVAMTLAMAGLACIAMARSHGGLLAGWVTVAAASLIEAWPIATRRFDTSCGERQRHDGLAWESLVHREVASTVLVALAGVCIAWVMPSWAFDPVALAVVTGDASTLRQAGPLGAPVAETITVVLFVAAMLRLEVWPLRRRGDSRSGTASDTLVVVRDVSAIALLVRYDVVTALAPVPLAGLGLLAVLAAFAEAARLAGRQRFAASTGCGEVVDPRPASAAVALLAMASFVPELAVAVSALAGCTWWVLRRVPHDATGRDRVLVLLLAPVPVGLGLAITVTAARAWTHVSAASPTFNGLALAACLAVGLALAAAAGGEAGLRRSAVARADAVAVGGVRDVGVEASREALRAGQLLVVVAMLVASAWLLPMPGGTPLSRAFTAHVAIPRGLTGIYAVGPALGWGDQSSATWSAFASVVFVFIAATVWAWWGHVDTTRGRGAVGRVLAWLASLDACVSSRLDAAAATVRGLGRALEFGLSRVAVREFVGLASDELDRLAIATPSRRSGRAAVGLALALGLVLGAIFANPDAATFTPTSLHGFPGLRARLGTADDAVPVAEPSPRPGALRPGARGGS